MKLPAWLNAILGLDDGVPKPRPSGWNKTLDDLDAEKRSLSGDEIEWAREYEREQLRGWARFPRDGEEFEAIDDTRVACVVHARAAYSSGLEVTLQRGTRIRVSVPGFDAEPVGVQAVPVDEKALEAQLVPEDQRRDGKYDGYSLSLKVAQLNREFRLVPAGGA